MVYLKKSEKYHFYRHQVRKMAVDPCHVWPFLENSSYRFWLDSGQQGKHYLAWGKPLWIFEGKNGRGRIHWYDGRKESFQFDDPLPVLRQLMGSSSLSKHNYFHGGAVGYWGYDVRDYFDNNLKRRRSKKDRRFDEGVPDFVWAFPPFWLEIQDKFCHFIEVVPHQSRPQGRERVMPWWRQISKKTQNVFERLSDMSHMPRGEQKKYEKAVRLIKKYIAAGDVYQANLTHRFQMSSEGVSPVDFFNMLRHINPSPYATLMQFPRFSLASCSPELLLRVKGKKIETRPIAGTRPRGQTKQNDSRLQGELLLSPKERAEHVMLVDLERNDLGRVCQPGSVHLSELMRVESYSHVSHIVSHVQGKLKKDADIFEATRALFPGGTITGCPKVRCMDILDDLESERRGPFFGSAGWMGMNGDGVLNILIRTALFKKDKITLRVGAGIVADSEPAKEYKETLHKAQALLDAWNSTRMKR